MNNNFYLMHKDVAVAKMEIDTNSPSATPKKVFRNQRALEHFPVGGQMNDMKFIEWWKDRAIPKTRQGAKTALEALGYSSTENALVSNLALSLTDCYWIKPEGSDFTWKDVNLFENDFSDLFGEYTFTRNTGNILQKQTRFNCAATQGEVQKKWIIDNNGDRCLVKGNYGESFQQSLNEIFAGSLYQQVGFSNYTEYKTTPISLEDGRTGLGCVSKCFCSSNVEAISAWEILQTVKFKRNESLYYPFRSLCLQCGIQEEEFNRFIDTEIMIDFLLSNTDRHMNNISILRDPDTLKLLGMAPVYDSGNSMFFRESVSELQKPMGIIKTHSFIEKETDLLRYVTNRNAIDLNKIVPDFRIFEEDISERLPRIPYLKERFERKMQTLYAFQNGKDVWESKHKHSNERSLC